jgi:CubicO group peptidase (beta-lactamase class C family)
VPHDLRSVSRSIVGMLYGIALANGKVPTPEAKLYAQFPEYADLAKEPGRDGIKVAHVLSMTLGTAWDEIAFPYSDPRNSEIQMDEAPDRYRFILDRPIVGEPGVKWIYCGGPTALLARLIAKGTGRSLVDFAHKAMFEPLGLGPIDLPPLPGAVIQHYLTDPQRLDDGARWQAAGCVRLAHVCARLTS